MLNTLNRILRKLYSITKGDLAPLIYKRQLELSSELTKKLNSTVSYGPFKGLKIGVNSWWGGADKSAMLLGLYEQEVLEILSHNSMRIYKTLIDLGAANGYYGVGSLVNNLFENSICYEASPRGREIILANANLNKVGARVEVRGCALPRFYDELPPEIRDKSVLLVDIEGGEFDLLDAGAFEAFKSSLIIVENHSFLYEDGEDRIGKLLNDSKNTHSYRFVATRGRDTSKIPELREMSDTERLLICSEGRPILMSWLIFEPLQSIRQLKDID